MAIADQEDVSKLTPVLEEDRKAIDKYPPWVVKLLERANRFVPAGESADDMDAIGSAPSTVRIPSPFSSYRSVNSMSLSNTMPFGQSTLSRIYGSTTVAPALNTLSAYEEALSTQFGHVLMQCESNFGQLLLTIPSKALHG